MGFRLCRALGLYELLSKLLVSPLITPIVVQRSLDYSSYGLGFAGFRH